MKTLYINTATPNTAMALYEENEVLANKSWLAEQNESETLQPAIDQLLKDSKLTPAKIDRLLVCVGPGGFTSTRVGVSAVNAWAFALNVPVAQVSAFDLFPATESIILVAANASEGWIKMPDGEPKWVNVEDLVLPGSFTFTGILNDDWKEFLTGAGGVYEESGEQVPSLEALNFSQEIVEPWYYKDPNITWSAKINQIKENDR
jgi:hypothetical protein